MGDAKVVFEGNGKEVSQYAKAHPGQRFQLTVVEGEKKHKGRDKRTWDEIMASIESFRGKLPILPDSAFSTDSLYD